MAGYPSPRRYAQAVFQLALERDELDTWVEDLRVLAVTLENRQFADLLDAPQVPAAHKLRAIGETLNDSVSPLAVNLVSILARRNLAHLVGGILEDYARLLDGHRGIERAQVASAVPLDDDQRAKIAELLEGIAGKKVQLSAIVEPQIIGGLIARVGDRVLDGSARARLADMRRNIVEQVS